MDLLSNHLRQIKVPTASDNIYSEECVFSYDTPVNNNIFLFSTNVDCLYIFLKESDTGLFVSLTSFLGLGKDFVEPYYQKTNHAVFLHIRRLKTEVVYAKHHCEVKSDFAKINFRSHKMIQKKGRKRKLLA